MIEGKVCTRCGKSIKFSGLCPQCINSSNPRYWQFRRSIYTYTDEMAHLVYEFKYNNNFDLLKFFSEKLLRGYENYFDEIEIDYILPVPISNKRRKERGYNQSVKLLQYFDTKQVNNNVLIRKKDTKPQSSFERNINRKKNIQNAFQVREFVSGKNILIVDDIVTSGSTLEEISKTLYKANAGNVYHLTLIKAR